MPFGEVPALPVVVPAAGAVLAILLWRLHRRGAMTVARVLVAAAVCVYGAGVVANTIFPVFLDTPGGVQPWSSSISTRLFVDYEVADAVQNVVVFMPVGVLVPMLTGSRSLWRVAAVGVGFSLFIETVQFFSSHYLHGGHVADVNDLFYNALGAPLGYGLLVLARRARWPSA